ncbi:MAG: nuclear transport factor 2 family protein [Thiohalocapsa sp.]|jgi:ketosteroid isomerase-like protein|uniref:nuclear transport factor 2 family protein n=1 Tax=Thiohalocapsa sp. TaxID=2497641 RepID=UPI0025FE443B|nr:nuclear transport factor 2 family protein [Thiohalocapsa sp.]MCG6941574.1 nuclear transport factor 2 family protein [Thiohalocapsa sp.]
MPACDALNESARAVVDAYLDALASHDHDAIAALIAPDGFSYVSPIASIHDGAAFLEYMMMTGGILLGIQRRRVFVDGDEVCHWLVFETQLSERISTPAAQWASVQGGRITRIELLFDPHRWRALFEPAQ